MDGFQFSNYGQDRDLKATESELQIFDKLKALSGKDLKLVRKSDNYLTAELDGIDLVRFKYTDRARWIQFPYAGNAKKAHIESPEEMIEFEDAIKAAVDIVSKIPLD